jgi:hypothetical protein
MPVPIGEPVLVPTSLPTDPPDADAGTRRRSQMPCQARAAEVERPTRSGPVGGHAPPDGAGQHRRPPRAAPPHPPRDGGQGPENAPGARHRPGEPTDLPTPGGRPGRRGDPSACAPDTRPDRTGRDRPGMTQDPILDVSRTGREAVPAAPDPDVGTEPAQVLQRQARLLRVELPGVEVEHRHPSLVNQP